MVVRANGSHITKWLFLVAISDKILVCPLIEVVGFTAPMQPSGQCKGHRFCN